MHPDEPNGETDPQVAPHVEQFVASNERLRKTTAEVATDAKITKDVTDTHDKWFLWTALALAVILVIAVLALLFALNARSAVREHDDLISQLQQQQGMLAADMRENCSLYSSLYRFYNGPAKDHFADGPAAYDGIYVTLQHSADQLDCGLKHVVPGT